ncbi:MAG: hypothetical protein UV74_C0013G0095 [Candidatus Woesebacteria bacterium GW2011_GWB1_43_14]|uniref:Uncharacterized protein n=1 Tax=Candidatus Woesebacteria bacterium GW2011_GWB1_43_14 TaxID=1618578 RepID=A0A0G1GDL8_9BACT|nr:MAG: hypothetical protein UV51_C0005G0129 [Candidatus Woesebacteria bacterium GW2011_GWC1_42_9]KKS96973.1 MAG: hypothetical protein UV74_C0013G0095 [Candidatus Woesebacteria bacterium GW2011_GWB1_43_14]
MMKNNPTATANALAATTGVVYVACRILVSLFPDLMFSVGQSWLHGIELTRLGSWNLSLGTFTVGLASSVIFAWVIGYAFAVSYNYFSKR